MLFMLFPYYYYDINATPIESMEICDVRYCPNIYNIPVLKSLTMKVLKKRNAFVSRKEKNTKGKKQKVQVASISLNENIEDDDVANSDMENVTDDDESTQDAANAETAEAKRIRIAREYLETMRKLQKDSDSEEEEEGSDNGLQLTNALKRTRLEAMGKLFRNVAESAAQLNDGEYTIQCMSGHSGPVTCVVLSSCGTYCFSGSKDNSLIKWNIQTGEKVKLLPAWNRKTHPQQQSSEGEVLAVALSSDDRFLVSGGRDKLLHVFDSQNDYQQVHEFKGHKDAVTSLSFQRGSYSLFSGSLDRCVKHWDLAEMGYIETLFGHQDAVTALDCLSKARPVSCSSDRTARLWKVAEEAHLVFRAGGHRAAADCLAVLTEGGFATAGQDGSLLLWKDSHKTPLRSVQAAHGWEGDEQPSSSARRSARWITSLRALPMTDLLASGSHDGFVRLWKASTDASILQQVAAVPVAGFVNALSISNSMLAVGTGCEHRLGRWMHLKGNRNKVLLLRFRQPLAEEPLDK